LLGGVERKTCKTPRHIIGKKIKKTDGCFIETTASINKFVFLFTPS